MFRFLCIFVYVPRCDTPIEKWLELALNINIPKIKLSDQTTMVISLPGTRFYFYNNIILMTIDNTNNRDFQQSNTDFIIRIYCIYIHSHFR